MSTQNELVAYIEDHLTYELLMTRHAADQLEKGLPQLDWNAYFECFAVHARILYDFLTDDKGSRTRRVSEYSSFKAIKDNTTIGRFNRLDSQVFHLGKNRANSGKIDLADVRVLRDWVDRNFAAFTQSLADPYSSAWVEAAATPPQNVALPHSKGPTGPAAPPFVAGPPPPLPPSATNSISSAKSKP